MLMVRRKCCRWIHCIHEKTGDVISLQIRDVIRAGSEFQVTLAVQDDRYNYRILKPSDPSQAALEGRPPPE
jgi:hypothetical protein